MCSGVSSRLSAPAIAEPSAAFARLANPPRLDFATLASWTTAGLTEPPGLLERLFKSSTPETSDAERPRNSLLVAAAKIVFTYTSPTTISPRSRAALLETVGGDRKACDAKAGFMLWLLSPADGIQKLAESLRNRVPITRSEAAIFLGLIGTPDAVRVLIQHANGQAENGGHEAACVLSLLDHPDAKTAAEYWNRRNNGYEEVEGKEVTIAGRTIKTWSMDEVMRASRRENVRHDMERLKREYGPLFARWVVS